MRFFASHSLLVAAVLPMVMAAAYGRSSKTNSQFIFTEVCSPSVSHCFLSICTYYLTGESSPFPP